MSHIFRICSLLLLMAEVVIAQDMVTLDFHCKKDSGKNYSYSINAEKLDLRKNEEYIFVLDSVNTIAFDVKLFAKSRTIDSNIPEILKGILPGVASEGEWIFTTEGGVESVRSPDPFVKGLIKRYQEFENQFRILASVLAAGKSLTEHIAANKEGFSADSTKARTLRRDISKVLTDLDSAANAEITDRIAEIETSLLAEYELLNDIVNGNPKLFADTVVIHNHGLLERYHAILQANKGLYLKAANMILSSAEAKPFVAKKHRHDGEVTTLHVTVINKVTKDTVLTESFDYFTKGGFDLDFTTGFFGGDVYTPNYYLQVDAGGNKALVQEDNPRFDLGVGALAHLSYRFSSCVKGGVAAGAYVSTIDGKVRYLLAPSLVLGRMKQVALSSGWAFAKVNRLSGLISSDGINVDKALPADISAAPLYEKWISGWFLSLTYNIGRK